MNETDDLTLVRQCLKGSSKAFETLVNKYQKPIFNVAYRMTREYDDSSELTQMVFVKAYEKLELYNSNFKFFSWLYRIAVNESLNFLKQERKNEELDASVISENDMPDQALHESEVSGNIQKALMKIDMNYRMVIILKHFQEFSYKEMSIILNIPEKTVKSRLFMARQKLKDVLMKEGIVAND
jgi:RNA polymerase sigma-70 factor (ECF subfamily)